MNAVLRPRSAALLGIFCLTVLAWAYLVHLASVMPSGEAATGTMPRLQPWGLVDLGLAFVMWIVMMVAMMLPSAVPVVVLLTGLNRTSTRPGSPGTPIPAFVTGYLAAWTAFSFLATLVQWGIRSAAALVPGWGGLSPLLGGLVLMFAAGYQWTPLKHTCLAQCRSPLGFIQRVWRPGRAGALKMGWSHGAYCVGCCWLLMGLLFVVGVMNLLWVAIVAAFVLLEKTAPGGRWLARATSFPLAAAGAWVVATTLL